MSLKIKICGMREPENILEVAELKPELMGFIFYPSSPRYAAKISGYEIPAKFPQHIRKAGVFVNADFEVITGTVRKYSLDIVQLHGNETPDACRRLKETGIPVIKAFNIKESTGFKLCSEFIPYTDYFLFDALTSNYGGSGYKFDWKILDKYDLGHPFFLSGGITPRDVNNILEITNPAFYGIDLNSRFEVNPGLKDIETLKKFISDIRLNNKSL
ncbi:MAG: phosphoribosylanthranilate isomerase [Bacteroidia bacterium]|nr:phosphoribosylanthranilate isomerase [Bacteroidia bacterium]